MAPAVPIELEDEKLGRMEARRWTPGYRKRSFLQERPAAGRSRGWKTTRMTAEATESGLLEAWRAGDGEAFAELVRRHQGSLLRLARALLGERLAHEDVVQEAFLRLAKSPPDLPPEVVGRPEEERAQLLAWLHRVTRNLCMDVMRSESRRRQREHDVAAHEAGDGGLVEVDTRDTRAVVASKLSKLPDDQRDVLVLRLLADKSYREIAAITGKKIGTVGWLVSVGLRALSAELAPIVSLGLPVSETLEKGVASHGTGLSVLRGEMS